MYVPQIRIFSLIIIAIIASSLIVVPQQISTSRVSGIVKDQLGSPVRGAVVELTFGQNTFSTTTDADGRFDLGDKTRTGKLTARASGFATVTIDLQPDQTSIEIQLRPSPVVERITVSSGIESRLSPTPASLYSLGRKDIETSGALTVDDSLRQVPGFSLFRRTGSLFANPTSQGFSLRGTGASGASRSVVLLDGVPLNSPFGGWVYWDRIPSASIERIEVLSGSASDIYGSGALGGVVNILSRRPEGHFASIEASYGSLNTPFVSFDAGVDIGKWNIGIAGQLLRTDGYIVVPTDQRGAIDTPAGTSYATGSLFLSRKLKQGALFVRTSSFGESRENGTPLQINNTRIAAIDAGFDTSIHGGEISLRLYGSDETLNQAFSSVAPDRTSESLTNRQRNPSRQIGFIGQWRGVILSRHNISAGVEGRAVTGHSAETIFGQSGPTANVDSGGRQMTFGAFAQDTFQIGQRWFLTAGGRIDRWANTHGFASRFPIGNGATTENSFPDKTETAISPRLSVLRTLPGNTSIMASVYGAFRAPTLNELYRGFRLGNVVTNANSDLRAERLTGAEVGVSSRQLSERLSLRGVFFWSRISDPIANVTVSTTPSLITRQRQNMGASRTIGLELAAEMKLPRNFRLSTEFLLTDSIVTSFPANTSLTGLNIPQVPKRQLNFQLSYSDSRWSGGLQGRFVGSQFEDDQNLLPLNGFFSVDANISRRITHNLQIFIAGQNITGVRYATGRTPLATVGSPALLRVGLRISFP